MVVVPLSRHISEPTAEPSTELADPMNWTELAAGGLLHKWWDSLPGYIDEVQGVLGKVQGSVDDLAARRETLVRILSKARPC